MVLLLFIFVCFITPRNSKAALETVVVAKVDGNDEDIVAASRAAWFCFRYCLCLLLMGFVIVHVVFVYLHSKQFKGPRRHERILQVGVRSVQKSHRCLQLSNLCL